jgi:hypothetical protein
MKPLLLLVLRCFVSIAVQAQNESTGRKKLKADAYNLPLSENELPVFPNKKHSLANVAHGQLLLKGAKPGVYRLPQNGMPYTIPDAKDIAAIPSAFKGRSGVPFIGNRPRIPNAIQPKTSGVTGKNKSQNLFGC